MKKFYYFGYGSNINCKRLSQRICKKVEGDLAILFDYKLVFNKKTSANDYAYANLERNPSKFVYGLLYKLTLDELNRLDKDEGIDGIKPSYERKVVKVFDIENNKYIKAYSYIASDPRCLTNELKPSEKYLNYYKKNNQIPREYIKLVLREVQRSK